MGKWLALIAGAVLELAAAQAIGEGEIWVWTTPDGSIHYTNVYERVPDAYRETARIAHEEGGGTYQRVEGEPAAAAPQPAAPGAPAPRASAPSPGGEAGDEATWREQARAIDERIAALTPQVDACATDHINRSPGDGSRKRREEREEAERCAQAREDLAAARADRAALEERAQREGIPPGWLRTED